MHKKIVRPMKREYKSPAYLARSNAIGLGLAFAPFPGQVPVVAALWVLTRRMKWRFSLGISLAWTFVSNFFTNLPLFYLYYLTGVWLRGHSKTVSYADLQTVFNEGMFEGIQFLMSELGLSILVGSLVFMIAGGAVGYALGYWTARVRT